MDHLLRGTISCKEDVKEQLEGSKKKKRGKDGNKKEEPSSCPQLLNSTTFTKRSRPKQLKMLSAINLFASLSLYHLPFEKDDCSRMV